MRIGITYGTFDFMHYGHVNLFKRIKEQCDYLIVAVSTDEFNAIKGKKSFYPYKKRKEMVSKNKYVDKTIPEESWAQKETDIEKYNVDVLFMGNDWTGKFDYLNCEVVYLERTPNISSTLLRERIKKGGN